MAGPSVGDGDERQSLFVQQSKAAGADQSRRGDSMKLEMVDARRRWRRRWSYCGLAVRFNRASCSRVLDVRTEDELLAVH